MACVPCFPCAPCVPCVAGRRYARIDEIGVPYVVTVDFDSAVDGCVTLRERDTCEQIRVPIRDVVGLVFRLTREAQGNHGPYFLKVLYIAALYSKYTKALTFENLRQRRARQQGLLQEEEEEEEEEEEMVKRGRQPKQSTQYSIAATSARTSSLPPTLPPSRPPSPLPSLSPSLSPSLPPSLSLSLSLPLPPSLPPSLSGPACGSEHIPPLAALPCGTPCEHRGSPTGGNRRGGG